MILIACGSTPPPTPQPSPPIVEPQPLRTCAEAAIGIEQATRSVRPPDESIVQQMRARCADDSWSASVIDCFAQMSEGDLTHCAEKLSEQSRHALFAALGGTDEAAIAIAKLRLANMHVGIPTCDALWVTTGEYLACDAIPIGTRAEVGPQIADSWNLPEHLPANAQARMTEVCTKSRETLLQQAVAFGCTVTQ